MRHTAQLAAEVPGDRDQQDVTAGCGRCTWRRDVERS